MRHALQLNSEERIAQRGLGLLELRRDRPDLAYEHFSRALLRDPDNVFALGVRADALEQLGRLGEAEASFDRIIELSPNLPEAFVRRARLRAHTGRQQEALADIAQAIALDPNSLSLAQRRAELLDRFGRREEAQHAFAEADQQLESALREQAGDPEIDAEYERARHLALSRRYREAFAIVDERLRRSPNDALFLASSCAARMEARLDLERALVDCDRALAIEPEHELALPARALVLLRLERWEEAAHGFDEVLRQNPRMPDAHYGRAMAKARSGDPSAATAGFAEARRLDFEIDAEFVRLGFPVGSPAMAQAGSQP